MPPKGSPANQALERDAANRRGAAVFVPRVSAAISHNTGKEKDMTNLQASKIEELKGGFKGEILLPSDGAYESARKIWNAMIDKRPAIIARCATTSDVVRGVNFARDNGLLLAVRGGGHNIAGNAMCDDGIVIDLSQMKAGQRRPRHTPSDRRRGCHSCGPRCRHASPRPRHSARH